MIDEITEFRLDEIPPGGSKEFPTFKNREEGLRFESEWGRPHRCQECGTQHLGLVVHNADEIYVNADKNYFVIDNLHNCRKQ